MSNPAFVVLHIYKGQTFRPKFELTDPAGTPLDITGGNVRMHVRKSIESPDIEFSFNSLDASATIDGPEGTIDLLMSAADTAAIEPTNFNVLQYVYDLELYAGTPEIVDRIMQGTLIIHPEVTR